MKTKTEFLHIRIDPKLKRRIQRAAKRARLSMSEFVAQRMTKAVDDEMQG